MANDDDDIEYDLDLQAFEYLNDSFETDDIVAPEIDEDPTLAPKTYEGVGDAKTVLEDISKTKKTPASAQREGTADKPELGIDDFFPDDAPPGSDTFSNILKDPDSRAADDASNPFPMPAGFLPAVDAPKSSQNKKAKSAREKKKPAAKPKEGRMPPLDMKKVDQTRGGRRGGGAAADHSTDSKAAHPRVRRHKLDLKRRREVELAAAKARHDRILKAREDLALEFEEVPVHSPRHKKKEREREKERVFPKMEFSAGYSSRSGLFGVDVEAERKSRMENYAIMRLIKKNAEMAEVERARQRLRKGRYDLGNNAIDMDVGTISMNGRDLFHVNSPRRLREEDSKPMSTLSERKDESERHQHREMEEGKRSQSAEPTPLVVPKTKNRHITPIKKKVSPRRTRNAPGEYSVHYADDKETLKERDGDRSARGGSGSPRKPRRAPLTSRKKPAAGEDSQKSRQKVTEGHPSVSTSADPPPGPARTHIAASVRKRSQRKKKPNDVSEEEELLMAMDAAFPDSPGKSNPSSQSNSPTRHAQKNGLKKSIDDAIPDWLKDTPEPEKSGHKAVASKNSLDKPKPTAAAVSRKKRMDDQQKDKTGNPPKKGGLKKSIDDSIPDWLKDSPVPEKPVRKSVTGSPSKNSPEISKEKKHVGIADEPAVIDKKENDSASFLGWEEQDASPLLKSVAGRKGTPPPRRRSNSAEEVFGNDEVVEEEDKSPTPPLLPVSPVGKKEGSFVRKNIEDFKLAEVDAESPPQSDITVASHSSFPVYSPQHKRAVGPVEVADEGEVYDDEDYDQDFEASDEAAAATKSTRETPITHITTAPIDINKDSKTQLDVDAEVSESMNAAGHVEDEDAYADEYYDEEFEDSRGESAVDPAQEAPVDSVIANKAESPQRADQSSQLGSPVDRSSSFLELSQASETPYLDELETGNNIYDDELEASCGGSSTATAVASESRDKKEATSEPSGIAVDKFVAASPSEKSPTSIVEDARGADDKKDESEVEEGYDDEDYENEFEGSGEEDDAKMTCRPVGGGDDKEVVVGNSSMKRDSSYGSPDVQNVSHGKENEVFAVEEEEDVEYESYGDEDYDFE